MDTTLGSSTSALVFRALDSIGVGTNLSTYHELLEDVFNVAPPAYAQANFGKVFRLRGRDAQWIASLLASDSYMEGYSANRLWQYASCLPDQVLADSIRRHAKDEAKHSRMFAASLFKAFPSLEDLSLRSSLESNSPDFSKIDVGAHLLDVPTPEELLNSMMLINLYEVKALVLCMLTKPIVLAHAVEENKRCLQDIFTAIEHDECQHIRYSASYIERAAKTVGATYIRDSLASFQDALNRVTKDELHEDSSAAATIGGL